MSQSEQSRDTFDVLDHKSTSAKTPKIRDIFDAAKADDNYAKIDQALSAGKNVSNLSPGHPAHKFKSDVSHSKPPSLLEQRRG